jgi:hypothetical protein
LYINCKIVFCIRTILFPAQIWLFLYSIAANPEHLGRFAPQPNLEEMKNRSGFMRTHIEGNFFWQRQGRKQIWMYEGHCAKWRTTLGPIQTSVWKHILSFKKQHQVWMQTNYWTQVICF